MTLKKLELAEIEKVVHGLWGAFDGKARITEEQMKALLDSLRNLDAGVYAIRAAREVYAKSGAAGFRNFARQTTARAFEYQRAAHDAQHGAGPSGAGKRKSPDDIAGYWSRVKSRKDRLYGEGVHDRSDAWLCFSELCASGGAGCAMGTAYEFSARVYGDEACSAFAHLAERSGAVLGGALPAADESVDAEFEVVGSNDERNM